MSKRAWIYLWIVWLTSICLTVFAQVVAPVNNTNMISILVWIVLGIYGQFFEVKVRASRHSYYPHLVPFFVAVVLLPPYAIFLVVAIPHVLEWAKKQLDGDPYTWYVQPFNIASHVIAGIVAQQVFLRLGGTLDFTQFTLQSTLLAVISSIGVYTVINHLLVGQILTMARQISWAESGVMEIEDLITDGVMMTLGYISALLWTLSPWLLPLVIAPFVMLYRALQVPELEKKANTDEKTGLWNASHFNQLLQAELLAAEQNRRVVSVIMADLDLLRNINNTYGHLAGDVVITGIGGIIRKAVRKQDTPSRFGGEEYAILLPNTPREHAVAIAERIRQGVEETPFQCSTVNGPLHATMSFGVACYPEDADSLDKLIYEADVALYQAKLQGRNKVIQACHVPRSVKIDAADVLAEKRGTLTQVQAQQSTVRVDQPAPASEEMPHEPLSAQAADASSYVEPSSSNQKTIELPVKQPSLRLWLFIEGVILLGILLGVLTLVTAPSFDWISLVVFAVLAFGVQWLQFSLYDKSSVSSAAAIVFASALVSGGPGVLVTSTLIALVHYIRVRGQFYKAIFNLSTHILAGMAPVLLAYQFQHVFQGSISLEALGILIPGVSIGAIVYFIVETGLVAIAISLSEGMRPQTVWNEQFRWLLRPYIVMGVLGMFLALAYISMGIVGVFVYMLPVIGLHHLQRMYVDRTQNSVRELRRMNAELAEANKQVLKGKASIEQMNQELMLTLSRIIDARDPYVSGHASKVADYARAVAVYMDLPEEQVETVYQAGLLHDIGKMGIPERILLKPGSLTEEEYEIIKQHTVIGAEFLLTSQALRHLAPVIRSHHEQWNGGGYPVGLHGEQIPLAARILAVCDAVEAMASDRPYQRNKPTHAILEELGRCAGEQFDPAVVEAFLKVAERQPHLISNSAEEVVQAYSRMTSPLYASRIPRWQGKPQLAVEVT